MARNDMTDMEMRASELAKLSGTFFRKCLDDQIPPFIAADLTKTYLQTIMLSDNATPGKEPWEKPGA